MDSTTEPASLTRELSIDARPETVWEFLVDPQKVIRWMGQAATIEVEEGGLYRVEVIPGHTACGELVELDPPNRIVYTWGWEPSDGQQSVVPPGSSTVEILLVPEHGGTRLVFTHRDLPSAESAESHSAGWDHYLPRLVVAAANGDPGRDPWLDREM